MLKKLGQNPKDLVGNKKIALSRVPQIAELHCGHAMDFGGTIYGPYNWRDNAVIASIYIDAAKRHLAAWFDGEEIAEDSGVHHLGHAMACLAILLDAQETGNLIDDRAKSLVYPKVLARLTEQKKKFAPEWAKRKKK